VQGHLLYRIFGVFRGIIKSNSSLQANIIK